MMCKTICSKCEFAFLFDPMQTPAQKGRVSRHQKIAAVIAYYPICPQCRNQVEVDATKLSTHLRLREVIPQEEQEKKEGQH